MDLPVRIKLLGGFEVHRGDAEERLPLSAQRLLALLALQEAGVHRATAAERLWPDSSLGRSASNLRSALWQVRRIGGQGLIECSGPRIRLSPAIDVDFGAALTYSQAITENTGPAGPHESRQLEVDGALSLALLPDWLDEWLVLYREHWDQVRLHTLETLARRLMVAERYLPALQAAFAAVAIEPVRESAHRSVIEVYLAEGNSACALKYYQRYRGLVHRELGVSPSQRMVALVQSIRT